MAVSFKIEFLNYNALATMSEIEKTLKDFESYANMDENYDEVIPKLIVSTAGAEAELENFLWDTLEEIQRQATTSEADYTSNA